MTFKRYHSNPIFFIKEWWNLIESLEVLVYKIWRYNIKDSDILDQYTIDLVNRER